MTKAVVRCDSGHNTQQAIVKANKTVNNDHLLKQLNVFYGIGLLLR